MPATRYLYNNKNTHILMAKKEKHWDNKIGIHITWNEAKTPFKLEKWKMQSVFLWFNLFKKKSIRNKLHFLWYIYQHFYIIAEMISVAAFVTKAEISSRVARFEAHFTAVCWHSVAISETTADKFLFLTWGINCLYNLAIDR